MTFDEIVEKLQNVASRLEQVEAKAEQLSRERDEARHERDEYKKLYELVSLELERTRRHLFGRKAEAVDPAQTQLAFLLATDDETAKPEREPSDGGGRNSGTPRSRPAPHGRNKVPEHLPIERIELLPPEVERNPEVFERIGEEVRELIEWRSASHVRVIVTRPKFVRKGSSGAGPVSIAEPIALPIERGIAGPGLLAWVLVSKFCDHLPLNRLESILGRYGAPIARSTMCGWIESMHALCAPLVQAMWDEALRSDYIAVDATGVLVQAAEQCRRGHFWVLASDNGHVLFRYTKRNNKAHVRPLCQEEMSHDRGARRAWVEGSEGGDESMLILCPTTIRPSSGPSSSAN